MPVMSTSATADSRSATPNAPGPATGPAPGAIEGGADAADEKKPRDDEAGGPQDQEAHEGSDQDGVTAQTQPPAQWKIQPLRGEPPLTLYRDKRMVLLPAGTEIDRFGEASGNVTYAARTEYRYRSLPAEWSGYTYRAYRLQRPLEALTGLAVPWFDQPGGGTAFVLPRSIAELETDGSLVEIEGAKAPGRDA